MLARSNEQLAINISRLCGWLYFLAWSLSFYPQPLLNYRRQTTQGLTPDFPLLNVLGFTCYTVSTAAFLYSSTIRAEYAVRHPLSPEPTVRFNDLAFGVHALVLCVITYSQFWPKLWGWKYLAGVVRHANRVTLGLLWGGIVGTVATVIIVLAHRSIGRRTDGNGWAWIDVIYSLTYVKLLLTFFKYLPQAAANFRRKSTIGWSIHQILLDFSGGTLSLLQLVIDSTLQRDWSGLTGNPVKLGLANISLVFDFIFITQHYVLYGAVEEHSGQNGMPVEPVQDSRGERRPLLSNGREDPS